MANSGSIALRKTQSEPVDEKFISSSRSSSSSRLAAKCSSALALVIYWKNSVRMSIIRNLLESPNGWTRLNQNIHEIKGLNSCFYFFSLKTGCKFIAVFEALANILQMCSLYMTDMNVNPIQTTEQPDLLFVTREPDRDMMGPITVMPIFESNLYFRRAISSVTVFRSLLLIVGAEWGNISCLILWICVTVTTTLISSFVDILEDGDLMKMFFRTVSIFFEIYFCAVVASLVLKLQEKPRRDVQETEVLFTQSEEA
ncbi:uncharacterized protein LOC108112516 [Drosophila eugracilis]|uniref:uncharacterized protein LOC108112516 n=1 Tax=Drosophila eugracilis TaxID=29029 RepID=UPI0007E888A5|nr:uncharacterized protein LOC108112516 [Drosophila eugracilis]